MKRCNEVRTPGHNLFVKEEEGAAYPREKEKLHLELLVLVGPTDADGHH